MIVRNIETVRKYVSVADSLTYDGIKPHLLQSERTDIKRNIGKTMYAVLDVDEAPVDAVVSEAYNLAQEAICKAALCNYLPFIKAQITEAGVFTSQNEDIITASNSDFKELQRASKKMAAKALDELLLFMEENIENFPEWESDVTYKTYKNTLVNSTAIFQKHYNIFNSRLTFMAIKSDVDVANRQYLVPVFGKELLESLKENQTNENRIEVKELLEKALVSYAVARVLQNGLFQITASGIIVKFDRLDYEVAKTVEAAHLKEAQQNKVAEGEQLLKDALEIITANANDFTQYTAPEESRSSVTKIIVTKGITMI